MFKNNGIVFSCEILSTIVFTSIKYNSIIHSSQQTTAFKEQQK
nr:MAG TPA: hypothetical protein [Caudoviricetes sp.]